MNMNLKSIYTLLVGFVLLTSCDMLDIQPTGKVIPKTLAEYRALLNTSYKAVPSAARGLPGFRSDEMYVRNDSWDQNAYAAIERWDDYAASGSTTPFPWKDFYSVIFTANYVIENRGNITEGSEQDIRQLVGECYLLRAYMHFLLVNLYGQPYTRPGALNTKAIPLKMNSDINEVLSRNTVQEVYSQVLVDIDEASSLMYKENWELEHSFRFSTLSATALKARVYLYMGDWEKAYKESEAVLAKKHELSDLTLEAAEKCVLPNDFQSPEAITALEQVMSSNYNQAAAVSATLLAWYGEGDARLALYFKEPDKAGDRFCLKGGKSQFRCTFRVGEFFLNAAESAARNNLLPQARKRLLELMSKRYTAAAFVAKKQTVEAMNQAELVEEIMKERARELAFEGHRWFDLRRTTRPRIEKTLGNKKYVLQEDDIRYTLPIPKEALAANPNLAN